MLWARERPAAPILHPCKIALCPSQAFCAERPLIAAILRAGTRRRADADPALDPGQTGLVDGLTRRPRSRRPPHSRSRASRRSTGSRIENISLAQARARGRRSRRSGGARPRPRGVGRPDRSRTPPPSICTGAKPRSRRAPKQSGSALRTREAGPHDDAFPGVAAHVHAALIEARGAMPTSGERRHPILAAPQRGVDQTPRRWNGPPG